MAKEETLDEARQRLWQPLFPYQMKKGNVVASGSKPFAECQALAAKRGKAIDVAALLAEAKAEAEAKASGKPPEPA